MTKTKMTFLLEKDEDGYPPDDSETIWVEDLGNNVFRIDNIPFYIRGVSPDDLVEGSELTGTLMFERMLEKSDISVIRLVFFEKSKAENVLSRLVLMGCRWEGSHLSNLYSVELSPSVDWNTMKNFLDEESSKDILDYEEASIRQ